MPLTLADAHSIAGAKARIRIEQQREGFERLARSIDRVGNKPAARAFRAEAARAIERAIAFEEERLSFEADRAALAEIRAVLDAELPDARAEGRTLTDAERLDWIIQQWKTVSYALAATEEISHG